MSVFAVGIAIGTIGASASAVSRALVARERLRRNARCETCAGGKFIVCRTCRGRRGLDWQPMKEATERRVCLCPTCEGTGMQKCINCLGVGLV